ncbi:MAG: hypothetical protein M3Z20_14145, partial [Chloroflexota bacterium]|nr:hypothetical protein [Chloroflexota bacterium]
MLWILAVVITSVRMTGAVLGLPFSDASVRSFAPSAMATAATVTILLCMAVTVATRAVRPAATWPALVTFAAVIVTTAAVVTGSLLPLLATVAFGCLAWLGGELLLALMPHSPSVAPVRVPLAAGLGTGMFGLLWLILGVIQRLDAASVLIASALTLAALILVARQTTGNWPAISAEWDRTPPDWYETVLLSLSGGLITFALLAAFVPENVSDATRQHLPIAREFWQSHGALVLASMPVSGQTIQNHIIFAVAYGFGGVTAANLFQAVIGLASIAGVAGLGWLLAGRFAAVIAASVFGAMPLVLWELG